MDKKWIGVFVVVAVLILTLLPIVPVSYTIKEPYQKTVKRPVEKNQRKGNNRGKKDG